MWNGATSESCAIVSPVMAGRTLLHLVDIRVATMTLTDTITANRDYDAARNM